MKPFSIGASLPAGRSSPRSVASCRRRSSCSGVRWVGVWMLVWTMRSPRPLPRRWVTPERAHGQGLGGLGAGRHDELAFPVEGPQLQRRPECGGRHRQLHLAVQVVAAAGVDRVGTDRHLDVEVAGRTRARADLALAGELDPGARVDTGGDPQLERAPGADPALARALEARVLDDGAEALAGVARPAGHHLAEERALDALDLAAAVADVAGRGAGTRLGPRTTTRPARRRRVDDELLVGAEHRGGEVDVEPNQGVLAALLTGPGTSRTSPPRHRRRRP